ncbi:MAG: transglutaminase domain-containing protein [Microcystaceae cyanobacterium]
MTTERERLEKQWREQSKSRSRSQKKRKASSYRKRSKKINPFQDRLIIIIVFVGILLAITHLPQLINVSQIPDIQKVTHSSQNQSYQKPSPKPISTTVGNSDTLAQYDFTQIDKIAASLDYQGTSVQELAQKLNAYAKTDLEKARLIYAWIGHHIAYNWAGFISNNYGDVSPKGVLMSRQGVCSGYANLYRELAQNMGLEAVVIEGYSKGYSYAVGNSTDVNHAWNGVKINGKWYLLDSTWGAGYIGNNQFMRQFNPYYFATPPSQFIYDHLPVDPNWQLLSQPYSKQQFENLPEVSSAFFKYGLKLLSHPHHTINLNDQGEVILTVPNHLAITANLSFNDQKIENHTLIQKSQNQAKIYVTTPSQGTYNLNIYAKPKGQDGYYPHVLTYRLIASQGGQSFPTIYSTFSDHNAALISPIGQILPANQSVYFKLSVPDAQEVKIITGNNWISLSRFGYFFEGTVPLESGKVKVVAKFTNHSNSYASLVEYDAR